MLVAQSMSATVEMTNDHLPTVRTTLPKWTSLVHADTKAAPRTPIRAWVRARRAPMTTLWVPSPHALNFMEDSQTRLGLHPFILGPFFAMGPIRPPGVRGRPHVPWRANSAARRPRSAVVPADEPTIAIAAHDPGIRGFASTPIRSWWLSRSSTISASGVRGSRRRVPSTIAWMAGSYDPARFTFTPP